MKPKIFLTIFLLAGLAFGCRESSTARVTRIELEVKNNTERRIENCWGDGGANWLDIGVFIPGARRLNFDFPVREDSLLNFKWKFEGESETNVVENILGRGIISGESITILIEDDGAKVQAESADSQ